MNRKTSEGYLIANNLFGNLKLESLLLIQQEVWLIIEFTMLAGL
jgi:hypothetical protein